MNQNEFLGEKKRKFNIVTDIPRWTMHGCNHLNCGQRLRAGVEQLKQNGKAFPLPEAYLGYTEEVAGSTPLYRFFNTQTGTHFYTAAEAEKDSIIANLPSFNFEGYCLLGRPCDGLGLKRSQ